MLKVYEDFGDVRYEGFRYLGFASWWRERVNTHDTRGEFLFAEPVHARTVLALHTADDVAAMLGAGDELVLAVPLAMQRQHIDVALDRLLKKHLHDKKAGRCATPSAALPATVSPSRCLQRL